MRGPEEFADTVVVPGPNVRSLFVDTETVEERASELSDDGEAAFCASCHAVYALPTSWCPADGTDLVPLPPADAG